VYILVAGVRNIATAIEIAGHPYNSTKRRLI